MKPKAIVKTAADVVTVSYTHLGVPGEFTHVCTGEAEITLENPGEISEDDVNRVQDAVAEELKIAELGGYVMHRSPAWFIVDDGKKTMMPLGAHGERLRAQVSFVVAEPMFIEDMKGLMGSMGVSILGFLSPTLGESLLLLSLEAVSYTHLDVYKRQVLLCLLALLGFTS